MLKDIFNILINSKYKLSLPLIKNVESNLISEESRNFLKNLKFNKKWNSFFEDKIAGLNSFTIFV